MVSKGGPGLVAPLKILLLSKLVVPRRVEAPTNVIIPDRSRTQTLRDKKPDSSMLHRCFHKPRKNSAPGFVSRLEPGNLQRLVQVQRPAF